MTTTLVNTDFANAYAVAGIGGLMDQSFKGYGSAAYGFGNFVQLVLVFSTVALIIPSIYSTALSMQNVGMWAVKIPRFVWATVAFVVFTVAAIAGREHFASVLSNFLNCLGYWYASIDLGLIIQGLAMGNNRSTGALALSTYPWVRPRSLVLAERSSLRNCSFDFVCVFVGYRHYVYESGMVCRPYFALGGRGALWGRLGMGSGNVLEETLINSRLLRWRW